MNITLNWVIVAYTYSAISQLAYYFVISNGLKQEKEEGKMNVLSFIWRIVLSTFPVINCFIVFMRMCKAMERDPFLKEYFSIEEDWRDIEPTFNYYGGYDVFILAWPVSAFIKIISIPLSIKL